MEYSRLLDLRLFLRELEGRTESQPVCHEEVLIVVVRPGEPLLDGPLR